MNQTHNNTTPKIVGAGLMTLFLAVAVYIFILKPNDKSTTSSKTGTSQSTSSGSTKTSSNINSTTVPTTSNPSSASSQYKDGTYKASINYRLPSDINELNVTLIIKDGKVSSVATDSNYGDQESSRYISGFENKVQSAVKGKSLSSLSIGRIGGASLTSSAFEDAVAQIQNDAQI